MDSTTGYPCRRELWTLTAILLVTGLVFAAGIVPTLSGDDFVHVYRNRSGLDRAWTHFLVPDNREYRPLVRLSLEWDNAIWKDAYRGFHVTNLGLHLISVLLFYGWASALGARILSRDWDPRIPALATALFALHPIHSYSVNAIMGRTDLLCMVGVSGALLLFLKGRPSFALAAFAGALLSKETAVAFPLFLALVLWFESGRFSTRLLTRLLPFFLLDTVYLAFRLFLMPPQASDIAVYLQFSAWGLVRNAAYFLGSLLFPVSGAEVRELVEAKPSVFLVAGACSAFLFLWVWRKGGLGKPFWSGAAWTAIFLLPVMMLFQRRFLYIPSAGFALAAAYLISRIRWQGIRAAVPVSILTAYASLSLFSTQEWSNASADLQRYYDCATKVVRSDPQARWYALNVPNGRGEAHLFTHESLRYALGLRLGDLPQMTILSRVNYTGDFPPIVTERGPEGMTVRIRPGPEDFFVFDAPEFLARGGRYLPLDTKLQKNGVEMKVTGLDEEGRVAQLDIRAIGRQPVKWLSFEFGENGACTSWPGF